MSSASLQTNPAFADCVGAIDWAVWQPTMRATLLFVIRAGRILLILKKRGLGAGKINGPGGRIEPGETPLQCAIREVEEELGVTPVGATFAGDLRFQFRDGLALSAAVFRAGDYTGGEPRETDEATPLWYDLDAIPYARMWSDDPLWLPSLVAGRPFHGRFIFDGERMVDGVVEENG